MIGTINDLKTLDFDLDILSHMVLSSYNDQEKLDEVVDYINSISSDLEIIQANLKRQERKKSQERDLILSLLAKFAKQIGFRVGTKFDTNTKFPYPKILSIDTPEGQLNWCIDDENIFDFLPEYIGDTKPCSEDKLGTIVALNSRKILK